VIQTATHWAYAVNEGGFLFVPKGTLKHAPVPTFAQGFASAKTKALAAVNGIK
jgi:hypothetical protein